MTRTPWNHERGTCVKGLFWPPRRLKIKINFQHFLLIRILEQKPKVKIFGINLTFTVAMETQMAAKIC